MMLTFPIRVVLDDDGSRLITCDLLPEVTTFGGDEASIPRHARLAIEEALAARMAAWQDIAIEPEPGEPALGDRAIDLSLLVTLKVLLYLACRKADVSRAELARRLGWHREQVDRLFRLEHASRIDQLEAAFTALGTGLDIELRTAA